MRKLTVVIAIAICAFFVSLYSCAPDGVNECDFSLSMAEAALSENDTDFAQELCDSIYAGDDFQKLNTEQRCRLALLLYRIADNKSDESRMAMAAKCMQSAIDLHRDSVESYINTCGIEDRSQLILVGKLCEAVNGFAEGKFVMEEELDSIYEHDQLQDPE